MDLELQTLKIEKRNMSFFTAYFITCFLFLGTLRNQKCYLPELFLATAFILM